MNDIKKRKESLRRKIWDLMERKNIASFPRPVYHRIPNFIGAEEAAQRLTSLDVFKHAKVVKINPDAPQKPVRLLALTMGKIVIMPTPRIRHGFLLLDPKTIPRHAYSEAATIRGAFRFGKPVKPWQLPKVDLVVVGSVVVNTRGARLGKGEGFAELEYAILRTFCRVDENVPVVTTVHDVQVVDEDIPVEDHDVPVDIIVTPTRVIETTPKLPKPRGLIWSKLTPQKFNEIPLLKEIKEYLEGEKHIVCREG